MTLHLVFQSLEQSPATAGLFGVYTDPRSAERTISELRGSPSWSDAQRSARYFLAKLDTSELSPILKEVPKEKEVEAPAEPPPLRDAHPEPEKHTRKRIF